MRWRAPLAMLTHTKLEGGLWVAGMFYGSQFKEAMAAFLDEEIGPATAKRDYARACYEETEQHAPRAAEFLRGERAGSGLSLEEVTLLALHDETTREPHCTAFVAAPEMTRERQTLIGQNWDWETKLAGYPGILELHARDQPAVMSYHYPGLWTALGINEHGVALLWTGGGYFPELAPRVGVPTYALIAEALTERTARSAVDRVLDTPNAGSFLFHVADESEGFVVEGIPHVKRVSSGPLLARSTYYEHENIVGLSAQQVPKGYAGRDRRAAVDAALLVGAGDFTLDAAQELLTTPPVYRADPSDSAATIDSFVALPAERTLHVRRGEPTPGEWASFAL